MQTETDFHLSFEFFPPRNTAGVEKLVETSQILQATNPSYFSVTFGAGGSTQERTLETCVTLTQQLPTPVAPHISCIGTEKQDIKTLLDHYQSNNIRRLVVLRGDMPSGMMAHGDFNYACELVAWIRKTYGDFFHIAIACYPETHPQSFNAQQDFAYFKQKVDAGANEAITQYFYNADSYFYFRDRCAAENITVPITPGIMPITNYHQLARFSSVCGAEIPRWIRKQLEAIAETPEEIFKFGVDVVAHLCDKLTQGGVTGLHFYTLNKPDASIAICKALKFI